MTTPASSSARPDGAPVETDLAATSARPGGTPVETDLAATSARPGGTPVETDVTFPSMGSHARLIVAGGDPAPARAFLEAFERRLTRFDPASELCSLNASGVDVVPASPLLRRFVVAALWAAERSGGLVDPTLLAPLRAAGYDRDRRSAELPLAEALRDAPPRAPAAPHPDAPWRAISVGAATIARPPGIELDSGGTGKGLAADLTARLLEGAGRFAVDCGGDLRVGGPGAVTDPFDVQVRHPLTGEVAHELRLQGGAVATSGLNVRLWRGADGRPAHHLLDPGTGRPAWTGLVGATALAPTALEAEVLAKIALLSGPARAPRILSRHGGLVVRDDGEVVLAGCLRPRVVVSFAGRAAVGSPRPVSAPVHAAPKEARAA
jgi:thiamine biosynthesis lipoprotein